MKPDHDYEHALVEIRKRLHGNKAVVFVGAGFSRNSVPRTRGQAEFPLWKELTEGLVKRLYPDAKDQKSEIQKAGETSAALRFAEEFETAFGRPALIEFVCDVIRDDEFEPSGLHRKLLELPWADVFTTNYDCLLERAARSISKRYDKVSSLALLPSARRPRILKLHGSMPDLEHLVLTEKDYRTYPREYAPFVATVQAALTENVLCLIGFSGDDPNFLAWSGWLRDELQNAVPKTYLFTDDELKPFQRQLLEERHIVPIPLKQLAGDTDDWEVAYNWLFKQLARRPERPTPSWNIGPQYARSRDDENVVVEPRWSESADWIDNAILWRQYRQHYEGWCVLYRRGADGLALNTEFWISRLTASLVQEWPERKAIFVLREIVWRWSTAMQPLCDDFVSKVLDPQLKRFAQWRSKFTGETCAAGGKTQTVELPIGELDEAYHSLLLECLRHAREIGDDARFQRLLAELKERHPEPRTGRLDDRQSFVRHQEVLHSLGRLKQKVARQQLQSWDTTASDVVWSVRRAGLCLESGLIPLGTDILAATLESLQSVPVSATLDMHGMSTEGLTLSLLGTLRAIEDENRRPSRVEESSHKTIDHPTDLGAPQRDRRDVLPSETHIPSPKGNRPSREQIRERLRKLADYGCNPSEQFEWLELATSPEPKATKGTFRREGFDIANVKVSMSMGIERQLTSAYRGIRFIEDAGLPLQIPHAIRTNVTAGLFRDATKTIGFFAPHEAVGLVLRSRDKKLVEAVLSRKCLAKLSDSQVNTLVEAATDALREALDQLGPPPSPRQPEDDFWDEQFQVACEVLGRVVVRLDDEEISEVLREVVNLPHHPSIRGRRWSRDSLATCVRRIAGSLGKASLENILPTLLATPVPGSSELPSGLGWYDPASLAADFTWKRATRLAALCNDQIDALLNRIGSAEGDERVNQCLRAAYLLNAGLLSSKQKKHFASSLFARCDEHGMPRDTGCFDSLVLLLPRMEGIDEVAMFRAKHFSITSGEEASWKDLRRTMVPFRRFRRSPQRSLKWTRDDLTTLLDLAEQWLAPAEPPSPEEDGNRQSFRSVSGDTERRLFGFIDWLATMEDIVLLNHGASTQQRDRADKLIFEARERGWCVTQADATRASIEKVTVDEAVSDIRHHLGDREPLNVRQACDAIVRWCELWRTRAFQVPPELLQTLGVLVSSRRHDVLPLLIAASMNVVECLEQEKRTSFFNLIEPGLKDLLSETDYSAQQDDPLFTIGMKLRIRVACARLASRASDLGLASATLDRWIGDIQHDVFSDVRREL